MSRLAPVCLIWLVVLCACSGLGGEPDIVATFAPPPAMGKSTTDGDWQPDIASGQQIFADNCGDCHGFNGDGQGELVLAGSVSAPVDMTDLAVDQGKVAAGMVHDYQRRQDRKPDAALAKRLERPGTLGRSDVFIFPRL